uniref:Uncharacterized protein n=1 Tax=Anguilla anguilla TaxID=7936 RepID=A0A0E9WY88_ANGAN
MRVLQCPRSFCRNLQPPQFTLSESNQQWTLMDTKGAGPLHQDIQGSWLCSLLCIPFTCIECIRT